MTFHFDPSRIRDAALRYWAVVLHHMLAEKQKTPQYAPSRVRLVEGERSDDWEQS
jgi:hypothetical protein